MLLRDLLQGAAAIPTTLHQVTDRVGLMDVVVPPQAALID